MARKRRSADGSKEYVRAFWPVGNGKYKSRENLTCEDIERLTTRYAAQLHGLRLTIRELVNLYHDAAAREGREPGFPIPPTLSGVSLYTEDEEAEQDRALMELVGQQPDRHYAPPRLGEEDRN